MPNHIFDSARFFPFCDNLTKLRHYNPFMSRPPPAPYGSSTDASGGVAISDFHFKEHGAKQPKTIRRRVGSEFEPTINKHKQQYF
jgi:hypothetical protein